MKMEELKDQLNDIMIELEEVMKDDKTSKSKIVYEKLKKLKNLIPKSLDHLRAWRQDITEEINKQCQYKS